MLRRQDLRHGWQPDELRLLAACRALFPSPFEVVHAELGSSPPGRAWCAIHLRAMGLSMFVTFIRERTDYGPFFSYWSETTGAGGEFATLPDGIREGIGQFLSAGFGQAPHWTP